MWNRKYLWKTTEDTVGHGMLFREPPCPLWSKAFLVSLASQRPALGDVVIDHRHREQHQEYECRLVDALFDLQADVAPHQALNQQQQNHAAVEDRDRQQVKDAKVQADTGRQTEQGCPAFFGHGMANGAADADRSFHLLHRTLALNHLLDQFEQNKRVALVVFNRTLQRGNKRQLSNLHERGTLEAHSIPLGLFFRISQDRLQLE